ncbi:MAG TPA: TonB-dependent receptor plug domain-containing protein, partial [Flavobacteriaceae bacterium]|nr:TonB-dependent receptor plug domain-containing protein [Flavobacteriaceae bacterium]
MNKKTLICGVLGTISLFGIAQQQADSIQLQHLDEVVITDSKFNLKRENSGKVITKITQKELQHLQGRSIPEIINTAAGIEINGTKSSSGQNLAYYIRGGRNRQVLVLIDDIAVTDPSQIANDYDLRLLNADQVESIEILKGASSTLYGSGAATAVINIKLKQASKDHISANFRSVLGTNQPQDDSNYAIEDFRNSVSVSGTFNKFSYLASFGHQYTDGLSAVSNGIETDVFNAINGDLKLGYRLSNTFKLNTYASFDKFKSDFDDGLLEMDANNVLKTDQYRLGISPEFTYKNGSVILNSAFNNVKRNVMSDYPAQFNAKSVVADAFNRYNFNDTFYTVIGLNTQYNDMESFTTPFGATDLELDLDPEVANFMVVDPYINVVYVSNFGLNINGGARLNNHSEYGSHLVYSLNPSFRKEVDFGYIKGLTSYSTAYITPSLYQLFEPTYGNTDLEPEETRTIEIGTEINLKDQATFSLVYFNRKEQNFIDFVDLGNYTYQYDNVKENFIASGLEFTGNFKFSKTITFNTNATYTKVEENLSLRLPKFKVNAQLDYQVCKATFLSLSYQFNDKRKDVVYNSSTFMNDDVTLKSYSLLDVYLSREILGGKMKLFA